MLEKANGVSPEVAEKLRAYGALENPIRLSAYRLIHDSPDVPFNSIAKELHLATGLAAYHVGVLKSAELVEVSFERHGRAMSEYHLTDFGNRIFEDLFGDKESRLKHGRSKSRASSQRARSR